MQLISGFSKLTKAEKIDLIFNNYIKNYDFENKSKDIIKSYWHKNNDHQQVFDEFSENTISNFYMPYGVVPNVLLNGEFLCVPMVIEESSVVAAASNSAKFWSSNNREGFFAQVISTEKIGQVHFTWKGCKEDLYKLFNNGIKDLIKEELFKNTSSMRKRGGGIVDVQLVDRTYLLENYFQLKITFETCNAMGANFINSNLELASRILNDKISDDRLDIIMSILSNYTPNCLVRAYVNCPIEKLEDQNLNMSYKKFAQRIYQATIIAKNDIYRATTHNKGIFNGMDAVALATGNDFRAIEACGHAYACKDGNYRSLTDCTIEDDIFTLSLEIPLSLGTVGGLTNLHPLAKFSLTLLNNPDASKLMMVVAAIGLAQNFAALKSLVTTGIQRGHMKMHLINILNSLSVSDYERELVKEHFSKHVVSYKSVKEFIRSLRKYH